MPAEPVSGLDAAASALAALVVSLTVGCGLGFGFVVGASAALGLLGYP